MTRVVLSAARRKRFPINGRRNPGGLGGFKKTPVRACCLRRSSLRALEVVYTIESLMMNGPNDGNQSKNYEL